MSQRIPVAVLGATGTVGQRFVSLLEAHPWFELVTVTGSERSVGSRYGEVAKWALATPIPDAAAALEVRPTRPGLDCELLFSALGSDVAGPLEQRLAEAGHFVVSNASSHRMDPGVPLIVPEVNAAHLAPLEGRSQRGAIVTNPNCSTIGLVLALAPLHRRYGVDLVNVVTMQAVSGAGLPGVPSLAMLDNVIPLIPGEEEKLEAETRKILGTLANGKLEPAPTTISAQCNRVGVIDGHTECVSLRLAQPATLSEVREALATFSAGETAGLPSAPENVLVVTDAKDRPQPRLDRDRGAGMAVTVGRIRPCPVLDWRMVVLSHNTLRGAATGSLLVAELVVSRGLVQGAALPG